MSNTARYRAAFVNAFRVSEEKVANLAYQSIEEWDSLGHMQLIGELEEAFDIELDIDDITDFSDYKKGKEILQRYGVTFDG
ncbi:MAG: acyl carrier protein [Gammaproteobacteria bacterium]|nr:acyl carrier protein [Gammaproteobacteria bacterium]